MDTVGKMTISDAGIVTELLSGADLETIPSDAEVKSIEDAWIMEIEGQLGKVIGYSEVVLDNHDEFGNRLPRKQETNTGDFVTDALYDLFEDMGMDIDIAVMNGGGIRNNAITGELTYYTCKEIFFLGWQGRTVPYSY